jgi:hypothetical protein
VLACRDRRQDAEDHGDDEYQGPQDHADNHRDCDNADHVGDAVQDREVQRLRSDLLQPRTAILVDQVRDERPDEAEERDADVGDDRPGLLIALRDWRKTRLAVRLLWVAGLTILLRRIALLSIPLQVRVAVRLVARLLVAAIGVITLLRIALRRLRPYGGGVC